MILNTTSMPISSHPKRVQRKRTLGYKLPPNTVVVSRPSKWGNPFVVGKYYAKNDIYGEQPSDALLPEYELITPDLAVRKFREYISILRHVKPHELEKLIAPLRGKNIACFCRTDAPCHGDVWLELAGDCEGKQQ